MPEPGVKACLLVGLGGFAGAILRHLVVVWCSRGGTATFPWGVLAVNAAGCLMIGLVAGLAEQTRWITPEVRWTVVTGFLGGLTTFSALGAETFFFVRSGQWGVAGANVTGNVMIGLAMVAAGFQAVHWVRPPVGQAKNPVESTFNEPGAGG